MSTIRDVAARAGVHPSTVSRVFSGTGKIGAATRSRVLAAAQDLDYYPHAIARSLSQRQTHTIGVVVPHIFVSYFEDSFFPQIMRGLLQAAYLHGYRVLVSGSYGHADEITQIHNMLASRQVDGIIALSSRLDVDTAVQLHRLGTPFVLIGQPAQPDPEIAWVDADNSRYTRCAVTHLIDLGHQRIAYVGGDPGTLVTQERLHGYQAALHDAGLTVQPSWIHYGFFAEEGGYKAAVAMMGLGRQAPTAFYAANDLMALGVLRALRELQIPVPEQVSVVGTNDSAEAARALPTLTSLQVPYAQMAATATEILIRSVQAEEAPRCTHLFECELIVRGSTGPYRGGPPGALMAHQARPISMTEPEQTP